MGNFFLGEIRLFAGVTPPDGWVFCQGQIMSIAQNTALFSLLGTTYGGNGQTTFALPDLRGRVPIHWGQGPGLSNYVLGETGGQESVSLVQNQLPPHNHSVLVTNSTASTTTPSPSVVPAVTQAAAYGTDAPLVGMAATSVSTAGSSLPHENRQPSLALNYIISTVGIYPSRS